MIVGVDARAAAEVPAGRGRYVRELLRAWDAAGGEDRFALYARTPWGALDPARFAWRLDPLADPWWHARTALRASRGTSAFLSTNSYLTAWGTLVPTAVVVYDLIPFVDGARAQQRAARIERATIRPALHRARALLCISEATRRDLVERFPRCAPRAVTVPLAADPSFGEPVEPAVLERPYVLAVGTLEPRKNLTRLVEAFVALPDEVRSRHLLALVGPEGWELDDALAAARAHPDDVRILGRVSDEELRALYAGAACFAYPSLYEGFGLPVLEAMAAGAPVVTSSVSSLPEVAGDAALLVDPLDVRALRDALAQVLADPALAARLRAAGPPRAATFSWERCAAETLDVLRDIAR